MMPRTATFATTSKSIVDADSAYPRRRLWRG